jgi:RimJ/RimL family protein N-acetyltransferase
MRLIPLTRELCTALARNDFSALRRDLADAEAHVREVAKAYSEFYDRTPSSPPWIGYFAEDEATRTIVGSCGYKGNCRDGVVEIAYFSFPGFERRGFATQMARQLNDLAWHHRDVRIIRAHTLQEENASVRIMRRLEFAWLGTVEDPEDGPVWRWELSRS